MARQFMHFPKAGVSLAVDSNKGRARVSLAVVNRKGGDRFSRPHARILLNARLDGRQEILKSLSCNKHTFSTPYDGTQCVNDILRPIALSLSEELELREKGRGSPQRIIRIIHGKCRELNRATV
jgi:hypothetical protein